MKIYLNLLEDVLSNGVFKQDRTGTGTFSVFGRQIRLNLQEGFPLLTTKKLFWKGIVYELLWFLKGGTNIEYLNENGVHFWNDWADENGNLGPVYGKQWRSWESGEYHIDQLAEVIQNIKENPYSRRLIVSAWNVGDISKMRLPPCHLLFQFYVNNNKLSCQLYQRSADIFLGVPFNIASYSLLTCMIAHICDLEPYEFIHTFGDLHLYSNHVEQAKEQLSRIPLDLPKLILNPKIKDIDAFDHSDIRLEAYNPHSHIYAPIAV